VDIISYPIFPMKISTIVLLVLTMLALVAPNARSEELERLNNPDVLQTIIVPLDFATSRHEVLASADKSATTQLESSVIHVDDNNRMIGLSN
jgi:hypothetical protein